MALRWNAPVASSTFRDSLRFHSLPVESDHPTASALPNRIASQAIGARPASSMLNSRQIMRIIERQIGGSPSFRVTARMVSNSLPVAEANQQGIERSLSMESYRWKAPANSRATQQIP
jgi:hypothetical protein